MSIINATDIRDVEKYRRLYRVFKTLGQDDRGRIDTYGKYDFWALDHSHPREDRLAQAMADLGIYAEYEPKQSDEMTGGAEEYDEIMAAHDLMSVR